MHITGAAWDYKPKHDAVMALLKDHRINAVEVDLKDESGIVNYASTVPLATTIGAIDKYYDLKTMIAQIHAAGGRVIGREVVFHDSKLAKWSWNNGHQSDVLQTAGHQPWKGSYGDFSFANFASPTVQQYNTDIAVEAAKAGIDDVLFDYVRRADGKPQRDVHPRPHRHSRAGRRRLRQAGPRRVHRRRPQDLPRAPPCSASPRPGPRRSRRTSR